jgi:predicted metal-dependent peptidase
MDLQESFHKGASGGGGTSFIPPFEWIKANDDEEKIDAAVYLTDLMGSFPREAPPYPVIWCTILPGEVPFGDVVNIPSDGTA